MREISQHITDLVENSARSGARHVEVAVEEIQSADEMLVSIVDDGCGMCAEEAAAALDPFYTTRGCRRVGLGLPLAKATAERCGGRMEVVSAPGTGTRVTLRFRHNHIDRPPLGNIRATLLTALVGHPEIAFRYSHSVNGSCFEVDGDAIRRELQGVPITHPSVLRWIEQYLSEGLAEIGAEPAPFKEGNDAKAD